MNGVAIRCAECGQVNALIGVGDPAAIAASITYFCSERCHDVWTAKQQATEGPDGGGRVYPWPRSRRPGESISDPSDR